LLPEKALTVHGIVNVLRAKFFQCHVSTHLAVAGEPYAANSSCGVQRVPFLSFGLQFKIR
jgi:hypothetical protein